MTADTHPEHNQGAPQSKGLKARIRDIFPGMAPLFVAAHFMHHVPGFVIQGVQTSLRTQFQLSHYEVGLISTSYSLAYGAGNLPAGWLGGRIAPRILITTGVVGVAAFGLLAGLSPTYAVLLAVMVFVGFLGGGYHACASPVVSDTVPREKRGQALGIHQIGGTAANMVIPVSAAAIAVALTWRGAYITLAIPTIVFGIFLHIVMQRNHLGDKPPPPTAMTGGLLATPPGYIRRMAAFMIGGTAVQIFVYSSLYFTQSFVVDELGGSQVMGGLMFSLSQFAGLFAGTLGGYVSDRVGKVPVIIGVSLAAGPLIYLLGLSNSWLFMPISLIAVGCCQYVAMPVTESYVITHASTRNRSLYLGIYYAISRGGPALTTPFIGKMIDGASFNLPLIEKTVHILGFAQAYAVMGGILLAIGIVASALLWGSKD